MLMSYGYLKAVFDVFDKYKCGIDMVSTSEEYSLGRWTATQQLPEICAELAKIADVKIWAWAALVCLVGEDIRGHNGIAGVFGDQPCECADDPQGRARSKYESTSMKRMWKRQCEPALTTSSRTR